MASTSTPIAHTHLHTFIIDMNTAKNLFFLFFFWRTAAAAEKKQVGTTLTVAQTFAFNALLCPVHTSKII